MVESVMIDAVRYTVEETIEVILVDGQACRGSVDYNQATIKLSVDTENMGDGRKPQTLMHEVIHALLYERGRYEDGDNEELVDTLASGVINLIRQNPELVDLIQERQNKQERKIGQ